VPREKKKEGKGKIYTNNSPERGDPFFSSQTMIFVYLRIFWVPFYGSVKKRGKQIINKG